LTRRVSLVEALARLPGAAGERFVSVIEHGTLTVEIYAPRRTDRFLLDTGATQWLTVPKTVAQSLRLDGAPRPGPTLTSNGESYPSEVARLADDVRIGAYKLTRPEVLVTPDEFPLMGTGFLRHFRLTIDQASRIVEFSRPSKDPIEGL